MGGSRGRSCPWDHPPGYLAVQPAHFASGSAKGERKRKGRARANPQESLQRLRSANLKGTNSARSYLHSTPRADLFGDADPIANRTRIPSGVSDLRHPSAAAVHRGGTEGARPTDRFKAISLRPVNMFLKNFSIAILLSFVGWFGAGVDPRTALPTAGGKQQSARNRTVPVRACPSAEGEPE